MSFKAVNWAWDQVQSSDWDFSPSHLVVLLGLADRVNGDNRYFGGNKWLAQKCFGKQNIDKKESRVRKIVGDLADAHLLLQIRKPSPGKPAIYAINLENSTCIHA